MTWHTDYIYLMEVINATSKLSAAIILESLVKNACPDPPMLVINHNKIDGITQYVCWKSRN